MSAQATVPVRELIVKIHERCNIACDHCYMYESADQLWRTRPAVMADQTFQQTARRLAEHADAHRLDHVRVVFHGGEPLLAGVARIDRAADGFRAAISRRTTLSFAIQTNGTLLDEDFLRMFRKHGIRVGVSLDGTARANDRHRRYASGRSSYAEAVRAISLLRRPMNRTVYGGLLCTVDLNNDPVETYLSLLKHEPPLVDLLLPHGNWAHPPPGLDDHAPRSTTPYANWLIAIFDRWYSAPHRETRIRFFESIIALLLGGSSDTDTVGLGTPAVMTIESDGSIEGSDSLKTTEPAIGATGLTVFDHSFDEAARHPAIGNVTLGQPALGDQCQRCRMVVVCGGGLRAHRFSKTDGFTRPSVYCADLYRLIGHVRGRIEADLVARVAPARA